LNALLRMATCVVAVVLLSGFAQPANLKRPAELGPASFAFVDARPSEQLKTRMESRMITDCAYASWRIGDEEFSPDLATALTDALATHSNDVLRGKQVRLVNFTVHLNNASTARGSVRGAMGGAIEGLLNDRTVLGCAADDLRGGYVASEVPAGKTPWVVVIDLEVDGRPIHVRGVQASRLEEYNKARGSNRAETKAIRQRIWDEDVGGAIEQVLGRLVDQIAR